MCPMCLGTAAVILSGTGTAGGAALVLGYVARRRPLRHALRQIRLRWFSGVRARFSGRP
jgi:hypothetical protein